MKNMINFLTYWSYYYKYLLRIKISKIHCCKTDWDQLLVLETQESVLKTHHNVNQKYDKKYPYYHHLKFVYDNAKKFYGCVDFNVNVLIGALLHDMLEDVHMYTYNNIKDLFYEEIAEIVYCCTELRGRNRAERHGQEYFDLLKLNRDASFVKLCDVIANIEYSKKTGSGMFDKYRKEYPHLKQQLYRTEFQPMFSHIESIFDGK